MNISFLLDTQFVSDTLWFFAMADINEAQILKTFYRKLRAQLFHLNNLKTNLLKQLRALFHRQFNAQPFRRNDLCADLLAKIRVFLKKFSER